MATKTPTLEKEEASLKERWQWIRKLIELGDYPAVTPISPPESKS